MPEETPETPDPIEALRLQLATANARLIQSELKAHAVRLGIIDLDGLKFIDVTKLKLTDEGGVLEAEQTLASLKHAKPWLFSNASSSNPTPTPKADPPKTRMAKDMSHKEWQDARERLIRSR